MYDSSGKTQLCVGGCGALLSWVSGLSFTQDIVPIISYIGICAGAFVGLHGVFIIVKGWVKRLRESNHFDTWY